MTRTVVAIALMGLAGCSQQPSQIRVQNDTGLHFSDVTVGTNTFGSVNAGALTEYQRVHAVFEKVSVYTSQADGRFNNRRFLGGPNSRLAGGRYTYILELNNDALEILPNR